MDDAAFIVLIADEGDPEHTNTRLLRSVEEAASHVQAQVEAGVEQSRIRAFASTEMAIKVTFRPGRYLRPRGRRGLRWPERQRRPLLVDVQEGVTEGASAPLPREHRLLAT